MKRYLLIFTLLGLGTFAWAQNASLVFQGENIKGLTLSLDGRVVNEQPSPSVRLDNLQEGFHKVSITAIANNGAIAGDVRDIILENGFTMVFGIGIANNGKVALRLLDKTDLQASTTTTTTTTTNSTTGSATIGIGTNLGVTITDPATGLPIQMGVNVNATTNGQQTNVDINGLPIQVNVGVPTTQTTTTTTVTTTNPAIGQPTPSPAPASTPPPTPAPAPTATTCVNAMDDIAFQTAANAVNAEGFSQTKLKICKQAFNKKCLSVNQVKALMELFNFENDKLEVAKYCYTRCTNRDDYYLVNEGFSFSSSKEELDAFMQSQNGNAPQD